MIEQKAHTILNFLADKLSPGACMSLKGKAICIRRANGIMSAMFSLTDGFELNWIKKTSFKDLLLDVLNIASSHKSIYCSGQSPSEYSVFLEHDITLEQILVEMDLKGDVCNGT